MNRPLETDATLGPALSSVVLAGQQLLADRVELALLDGQRGLGRMATSAALWLLGGLLLLSALAVADVALIDVVAHSTSRVVGLLGCAALHGSLGGALLLVARARRRP